MSDDGSDTDMQSAVSHQVSASLHVLSQTARSTVLNLPDLNSDVTRAPSPMQEDEPVATKPSLDLMHRIPGMYRLLDLVQERGSGGVGKGIYIPIKAPDSIPYSGQNHHRAGFDTAFLQHSSPRLLSFRYSGL
jgi:hypothetical protein